MMDRHISSLLNRCLRHGDKLVLSIRLESAYIDRKRFFCVISSAVNRRRTLYSILGIDSVTNDDTDDKDNPFSIGLAFQIDRNTKVSLDGDGGFSVFRSNGEHYIFKPVTVQGLWTVIQERA